MARWARDRRVFYVEEPLFDALAPRVDVRSLDGLRIVVPHLPPDTPVGTADEMQRALLDRLVSRERLRDPIAWYYTPMPIVWSRHLRAAVTVYDCMDELSYFHGAPAPLRSRERTLFEHADLVFTGGQSLYEAKREEHPRVYAFPSSVDAAHFAQARAPLSDPADQRMIPHPRLGFFGVVDERMDLALLRAAARLRPDLHFVIIGPVVKISAASLPRAPNIHWLGGKTYDELPSYAAGWDVAIMPFARNDATTFISPTKTLEYLAAGKPVVSTSIRDVVRPYGEQRLVRIADEPAAFVAAVDAALAEPPEAARRDTLLAQTSWDHTFARMRALVDEMLARRRRCAEREEEAPCSTI
jgi:UDP-galactopyranose mutase